MKRLTNYYLAFISSRVLFHAKCKVETFRAITGQILGISRHVNMYENLDMSYVMLELTNGFYE